MRGAWVGAFVVVGLLAACGKFGTDEPASPADMDDGGVTPRPSSSSGTSGNVDPPTSDAGPDAAPPVHGPMTSCGPADLFCDLFDRTTPVEDGWTRIDENHGDVISLVEEPTAQGSGALRFEITNKAEQHPGVLYKTIEFPAAPFTEVTLEFSFRAPPTFHPKTEDQHLNLAFLNFNVTGVLALIAAQDKLAALSIKDAKSNYVSPGETAFVADTFNDVRMTIDVPGNKATLVVNDGAPQSYPILLPSPLENAELVLGPSYSDVGSTYTLYYDAVRVTAK